MTNAEEYAQLEKNLNVGRKNKTLNQTEEDTILSQLAELWWKLTNAEQQEVEDRFKMRGKLKI